MEIRPAKAYKKPLYALGLATAIMSVSLTGCADFLSSVVKAPVFTTTETVQLAGETSVMHQLEAPVNTEYDVSPYRIKDSGSLSSFNTVTDKNELEEFVKTKLVTVSKGTDKYYAGVYQNHEFTIIGIDNFHEWAKANDYSANIYAAEGLHLGHKRNSVEYEEFDLFKDPSGKFLVITKCRDYKIIYEFFNYGNSIQKEGSGNSNENIRQDGNKEFPVKYDSFVVTEFYERIMEAKYALRWSRDNHVVLFEDSKCTSGKDMWEAFVYSVYQNRPATVLLADYHKADKKKKQDETLDFYMISYERLDDGSFVYNVAVRRSSEKRAGYSDPFKSFCHFRGTDDIYVFTNEEGMSAEQAEQLKVGPEHNEEGIINRFVLRFSTDS